MNFSFYTCQCPAARCFACTKPSTWHSNCDDAVFMGGFRISQSFAHFDTICPNFKIKTTLRFPYGLRAGKLSVGPSLLHQLSSNLSFQFSFVSTDIITNMLTLCHPIDTILTKILTFEAARQYCSSLQASLWTSLLSCNALDPWVKEQPCFLVCLSDSCEVLCVEVYC